MNCLAKIYQEFGFHPFADIWPLMSDAELDELAEDIKANGLTLPIFLYQGKILDGRNRWLACRKIGAEATTALAPVGDDDDALAFVVSLNDKRRHLSIQARALAAAKIANLKAGRPWPSKVNCPIEQIKKTNQAAADLMGVSLGSVRRAKRILAHGDAGIIKDVEAGRATLHGADEKIRATRERALLRNSETIKTPTPTRVDRRAENLKPVQFKIPDGETIVEFYKRTRALCSSASAAAKQCRLDPRTYLTIETVVLLSELDGLSNDENQAVKAALDILEQTRQALPAQRLVADIARRVWPSNVEKSRYRRGVGAEGFLDALALIENSSFMVASKNPYLSNADRAAALKSIRAAKASLNELSRKLERKG